MISRQPITPRMLLVLHVLLVSIGLTTAGCGTLEPAVLQQPTDAPARAAAATQVVEAPPTEPPTATPLPPTDTPPPAPTATPTPPAVRHAPTHRDARHVAHRPNGGCA